VLVPAAFNLCAESSSISRIFYFQPSNLYSRLHDFTNFTSIKMRFSTIAAFATSLAVVSAQTPDLSAVPNCAVCLPFPFIEILMLI
jgi:hypothetical protein